jgi:hypothetical protein
MPSVYLNATISSVFLLIASGCGSSAEPKARSTVPAKQQPVGGQASQPIAPSGVNTGSQDPAGSEKVPNQPANNETSISPTAKQQMGHITYTLQEDSFPSTSEGTAAKATIKAALDQAIKFYNTYTDITKNLTISYDAGVATADGNYNGSMRFGPNRQYMVTPTIMHEIAHIVGVGTVSNWGSLMVDGKWTGKNALAQLRSITGDSNAILNGDKQHFWPYGINYASEVKSDDDLVAHCQMVMALRRDMGLN